MHTAVCMLWKAGGRCRLTGTHPHARPALLACADVLSCCCNAGEASTSALLIALQQTTVYVEEVHEVIVQ